MLDLPLLISVIQEKNIIRILLNPTDYGQLLQQLNNQDLDELAKHGHSYVSSTKVVIEKTMVHLDAEVLPGHIKMVSASGRVFSGKL